MNIPTRRPDAHSRTASPRALAWLAPAVATAALTSAWAAGAAAGPWKGTEESRAGVMHMLNPAQPMNAPRTIALQERFRLGGEDEDVLFGVVADIQEDAEGNLYLLDAQLNQVQVFDKAGAPLRNIGREGEGPGEFRGANSLIWTPDGNLGVLQVFPSKIVVLTRTGEPAGEIPTPKPAGEGFAFLLGVQSAGDRLAMVCGLNQPSEQGFTQKNLLCYADTKGSILKELHSASAGMQMANPVIAESQWDLFRNRWQAADDGRVFTVKDFRKYEITVWTPDGKGDRVIVRDYPAHVRSADEKKRVEDIYRRFTRQVPVPNLKYEMEPNHPPIDFGGIHVRDDGSLWVETSRSSTNPAADQIGVFDVFDRKGHFAEQVTLKGYRDHEDDAVFFVGEHVFVITDFISSLAALQGGSGGEEEAEADAKPMEVICYDAKPLTDMLKSAGGPGGSR